MALADKITSVHPAADAFPEMRDDEYARLKDSIELNGLLTPIWVDALGTTLLDGRHRLRACRDLGITPRIQSATVGQCLNEEKLLDLIVDLNTQRRELDEKQKWTAVDALLPLYEKAARKRRERTQFGGHDGGGEIATTDGGRGGEIATPSERGKVRDLLAERFGLRAKEIRMTLCKDSSPVMMTHGCGNVMESIAWTAWTKRTEDGSWTEFYVRSEDVARDEPPV